SVGGISCQANVCRGGDSRRLSDHHDSLAHYQLLKRELGYSNIRSINKDRYNHMNLTAADSAAASGAVSGYRVIAYKDAAGGLGPVYGQTDTVLAVPNQATVGN